MKTKFVFAFIFIISIAKSVGQIYDQDFYINLQEDRRPLIGALIKQADGKIVVFGHTEFINGRYKGGVFRINTDLTLDENFNCSITSITTNANGVAIQPDGKVVITGQFYLQKDDLNPTIMRLNSDGSRDNSFNTGSGFDDFNLSVAVDADGKVIVLGSFHTYNGQSVSGLIRLLPDGAVDDTFVSKSIETGYHKDILIQSDGKILLAGVKTYDQNEVSSVIRLNADGSLDNSFTYPNANEDVRNIHAIENNKFIVTGLSGATFNGVCRINNNGTIDNTFNAPAGLIPTGNLATPWGSTIQDDGKILAGGYAIVRLNADGSQDNLFNTIHLINGSSALLETNNGEIIASQLKTFDGSGLDVATPNLRVSTRPYINSMFINDKKQIVIAGGIDAQDGVSDKQVAIFDTDGNIVENFEYYANRTVYSIHPYLENKYIVALFFYDSEGGLARIDENGNRDLSFDVGTGFAGNVYGAISLSDGKIIAYGTFPSFNGFPGTDVIVRLNSNGTLDESFNPDINFYEVNDVLIRPDGKMFVAGRNKSSHPSLLLLNEDGSINNELSLKTESNGSIDVIKIDNAGNIFVGGIFTKMAGIESKGLIKLQSDGSVDESFNVGLGFDNWVLDIELLEDGKILVGGLFRTFNGVETEGLVLLNADGTLDNSIVHNFFSMGGIRQIESTEDFIFVAGNFQQSISPMSGGLIRFKKSTITAVNNGILSEDKEVVLYPNPASHLLNVKLDKSYAGPISLSVIDNTGRILINQVINKYETNLDEQLSIESLSSGIYCLQVKGKIVTNTKFIISR